MTGIASVAGSSLPSTAEVSRELDSRSAGAAGALDLQEGLSDVGASRCTCASGFLRLLSSDGELVPLRGRAVNRCAYCARLAAVENTEMLALDALEGDAPRVWLVLTTRTATVDMAAFYEARAQLMKAIRRRWRGAEYACLLEFTTGYGPRAGGRRRPHWNVLLKGVGPEHLDELRDVVARVWCPRVDALPAGQHVGEISSAGGLMRYVALHFQKEAQTPPAEFRGQRFNCSRAYFTGCSRAIARARARESLRLKRELWRARRMGLVGHDAELEAQLELRRQREVVWCLANDRGARLSSIASDPRRRVLPRDRTDAGEALRAGLQRMSALARSRGLARAPGHGQVVRGRSSSPFVRPIRRPAGGPLRLFTVQLCGVRGESDGGGWRVAYHGRDQR